MDTRTGPVMVKWFGDPGRIEAIGSSLRLLHWTAQQGASVVQIITQRNGGEYHEFGDGLLVVFEYVDGAVGAGNWRSLGRTVARLHMLAPPEYAERSPIAPRVALPRAYSQMRSFTAGGNLDAELADYVQRGLELLRELPVFLDVSTGLIHGDIGIAHTVTRPTGEITFLDTLDIGIGPLVMDFPPILCEHLSHMNEKGFADRLDLDATRQFFDDYQRVRPLSADERESLLVAHQIFMIGRAVRTLEQAIRSGSSELRTRAIVWFQWLDYVGDMIERDLAPVLRNLPH